AVPIRPAQMSGRYSSITSLLRCAEREAGAAATRAAGCLACRLLGGRERPVRQALGWLRGFALRPRVNEAVDVIDAHRENDPIDEHEQRERAEDTGTRHR